MKTIWLIDDDEGIRDVLPLALRSAGFEAKAMSTGEELLREREDWPHAILLDHRLSGMIGIDMCRRLKDNPLTRHIPIIIISGTQDLREQAISAGCDDFLPKPFSISTLLKMIRSHTDKVN